MEQLVTINQSDKLMSDTFKNAIEKRLSSDNISLETYTDSDGNSHNEMKVSATDIFTVDGGRKQYIIKDIELQHKIADIQTSKAAGDVLVFKLVKDLSRLTVDDSDSLGFDSVDKMIESLFGYAKTTSQSYRRLARYFVNDNYTLVEGIPADTNIGTLNQLLSLVEVDSENGTFDIGNVKALFRGEIITPYMKQAVVKNRLSALKKVAKTLDNSLTLKDMSDEQLSNLLQLVKDEIRGKKDKKVVEQKSASSDNTNDTTNNNISNDTTNNNISNDTTNTDNSATKLERVLTMLTEVRDLYPTLESEIFELIENIRQIES